MTLKELRKQILKLTQAEFAEQLGVSVRTYIRYEHDGAPEPILKLAGHIAAEHLAKAKDDN
ncbi:helix-turn-helix transcriptional regulator [Rhodoferax mekongensis]|uniref:Helix-turn-helix transcriptional regulator n=1 Tax=Rhodoferax mekongensis TaxID=3068341 RepID=A0ABZ0B254_9BURK|nr:helix-turn-helix transcriptional regulator [Rhodoferax sp. TBRC 17307]WNO05999.1 helix-turn-helix transcriptional regulator [Rhodoferax sp. TBRC 17307]